MDVAKVDPDTTHVTYVATVLEVRCKRLCKMFYPLHTYVPSILIWMFHMFHTYAVTLCSICFICFSFILQQNIFMLQVATYVVSVYSNVSSVFGLYYLSVSCCKSFILFGESQERGE
jgi:hypothetical protein